MAGFVDTLGNVLTSGIDAAKQVAMAKFQVSNPYPNSSTAGGVPVQAGYGAGGAYITGVPPMLLLAGAALVAFLLLRK